MCFIYNNSKLSLSKFIAGKYKITYIVIFVYSLYAFFILVFFMYVLLLNNLFHVFRLIEKRKEIHYDYAKSAVYEKGKTWHIEQNETFIPELDFHAYFFMFALYLYLFLKTVRKRVLVVLFWFVNVYGLPAIYLFKKCNNLFRILMFL